MDFISRILSFSDKLTRKKTISELSPECARIIQLREAMYDLLKGKDYVAKSEYIKLIPEFKDIVDYFRVLQNSKMLKNYCAQNRIAESDVIEIIDLYDHLEIRVDDVNDKYIENLMVSEKRVFR